MGHELKSLSFSGYKTYRELPPFELGPLSVLIGGNGSGKSNLLSFFALLYRMMSDPGELQLAVAEAGGAGCLLHDGPKVTREISARLELETDSGLNAYQFRLADAANDTLIFADERWSYQSPGHPLPQTGGGDVAGHRESHLKDRALQGNDKLAFTVRTLLRKCVACQFHDTSRTSGLRRKSLKHDNKHLHRDGANLAAFLHGLSVGNSDQRLALRRIQDTIRQVLPFFAEFVLEPENGYVLLNWREQGSEQVFSAAQASDGMLRIIALIALLRQPKETLPILLMLDEPELGLHPQAIALVAALIRQASKHCQILVATQSAALVDEFELEEVVVLSRDGRETTLKRLTAEEYAAWLEDYSVGELWRKNLLCGGPGR